MQECRCKCGSVGTDNVADEGQFAKRMAHVHAVTNDEFVRTDETDEVGLYPCDAFAGFVEENDNCGTARAALCDEIARKRERAAGFQNIIDDQDIAAADIGFQVAQDCYRVR